MTNFSLLFLNQIFGQWLQLDVCTSATDFTDSWIQSISRVFNTKPSFLPRSPQQILEFGKFLPEKHT